MRVKLLIISTSFVLLLLSACSQHASKQAPSEPMNNEAAETGSSTSELPLFTMKNLSGNMQTLESLKGKKVFVNLWASWCPPCKREMPSIEKLYRTIDTSKVAFVMLSLDESFAKAKDYIEASKLDLPVYYPADNLPVLFNVQSIPTTFIFNEKGDLMKRVDGSEEYDTDAYRALLK